MILSIVLICGLLGGLFLKRFNIPAVTGYVAMGIILGVTVFRLVPAQVITSLSPLNDIALGLIAFSIGGELTFQALSQLGLGIILIATCEATGAFVLVTSGMLLLHLGWPLALLLGAVASATAPAATVMVLRETKSKGPLTSTILAVVAMDDAICLMIYALAAAIAKALITHNVHLSLARTIGSPFIEILGSFALGIGLGLILSWISRRLRSNTESTNLVLGGVFLASSLAGVIHLSPLLTCMVMGMTISNYALHKKKLFELLEPLTPVIYTAFFVLAGARLDPRLLVGLGLVGLAYTALRFGGKMLGSMIGAGITHAAPQVKKNLGFALLSQIGVAVGLAITISNEFADPHIGTVVTTILLGTTIITEIVGPALTRMAVTKTKEAGKAEA